MECQLNQFISLENEIRTSYNQIIFFLRCVLHIFRQEILCLGLFLVSRKFSHN